MRLIERFPGWFPSLEDFEKLDGEAKAKLITYEIIRESEEAEKFVILRQMIMESALSKGTR